MAICESCGREETSVVKVQRMYLTSADSIGPAPSDVPQKLDPEDRPTAGDIEMWCASCCATFPHVTIDPQ